MKISVFGLGYVGAVLTGCFARDGHYVIGVDVDAGKASMVNEGKSPIIEKGLEELISDGVRSGRIIGTTDHYEAVRKTDVSMICVGTPSKPTGELDLSYILRVSENIGRAIKEKRDYHIVVVRSTVLPGTCEEKIIPVIEQISSKKFGSDFGVVSNPEFLREGSAIEDFLSPPMTVIGAEFDRDFDSIASLYEKIPAEIVRTSIKAAEMVKYASNAFHALKIVFANEIGSICKQYGVNSAEVMEIFCLDKKLNISSAYLKPGFAFGGSCLPKDLRALVRAAQNRDVETPLLRTISYSNELQIKTAFNLIAAKDVKKIGILGFAFKGGTDDLRESPIVTLIEMLIGRGYDLKLFDRNVSLARLVGANKRYIQEKIPHISRLMVDDPRMLARDCELVVIGNEDNEVYSVLEQLESRQFVIDLRPASKNIVRTKAHYERLNG
ncbi:MAG: nucleotide sugar dehydrogenase [Verrucomicrobiia bacterium]